MTPQQTFVSTDVDTAYLLDLENRIEQACQTEAYPYTEIDSHYDFGRVFYRVWHGRKCLGTFYRSTLFPNKWESEAFYNNSNRDRNIHNTPDEAQAAIVSQSGLGGSQGSAVLGSPQVEQLPPHEELAVKAFGGWLPEQRDTHPKPNRAQR